MASTGPQNPSSVSLTASRRSGRERRNRSPTGVEARTARRASSGAAAASIRAASRSQCASPSGGSSRAKSMGGRPERRRDRADGYDYGPDGSHRGLRPLRVRQRYSAHTHLTPTPAQALAAHPIDNTRTAPGVELKRAAGWPAPEGHHPHRVGWCHEYRGPRAIPRPILTRGASLRALAAGAAPAGGGPGCHAPAAPRAVDAGVAADQSHIPRPRHPARWRVPHPGADRRPRRLVETAAAGSVAAAVFPHVVVVVARRGACDRTFRFNVTQSGARLWLVVMVWNRRRGSGMSRELWYRRQTSDDRCVA